MGLRGEEQWGERGERVAGNGEKWGKWGNHRKGRDILCVMWKIGVELMRKALFHGYVLAWLPLSPSVIVPWMMHTLLMVCNTSPSTSSGIKSRNGFLLVGSQRRWPTLVTKRRSPQKVGSQFRLAWVVELATTCGRARP